jgi:hypothetical protein
MAGVRTRAAFAAAAILFAGYASAQEQGPVGSCSDTAWRLKNLKIDLELRRAVLTPEEEQATRQVAKTRAWLENFPR